MKKNVIVVNGIEYIEKLTDAVKSASNMEEQYYIVRTYSAGVFAGYIKTRDKDAVTLTDARRLWRWAGASSLSQLAMEGVKLPKECKFPCEVDEVVLFNVIEILTATNKAKESIKKVPIWEQ